VNPKPMPDQPSSSASTIRTAVVCRLLGGLSWLTRSFHSFRGRWRLMAWLNRNWTLFAACGQVTVRTHRGLRMAVDPFEFVGRHIYVEGVFEHECTDLVLRLVKPGDCFLDVGAHIGYFTLLAARAVGPRGTVHAFEASPHTSGILRENITINGFANVQVHEKAVSDTCGVVTFYTSSRENLGRSGMLDPGGAAGRALVPSITVDSLLPQLPKVKMVKIDVEGGEMLVIRGMDALIARDKPYILFELTQEWLLRMGTEAASLCGHLKQRGYALFRVNARLETFDNPPMDQCNVLAVHDSAEVCQGQSV